MEIETPCNKICVIDPATLLCRGCGRTGEEIAQWMALSPAHRRAIMTALPSRMAEAGLTPPAPSLPDTKV